MDNHKSSPLASELLAKIIAAYADIWADVLLGKNLSIHLKSMEDDLKMLNELIDGKESLGENPLPFYRIANRLFRMKDVVTRKIAKFNQ